MSEENTQQGEKEVLDPNIERYKVLQETLSSDKYNNQTYKDGNTVVLDSKLFEQILNVISDARMLFGKMESVLTPLAMSCDAFIKKSDLMTLDLVEKHVQNIDLGLTEKQV